MSQTKKKKVETTVEVSQGFRLKITNLKKEAFPGPLTESDYGQYKVGDYLIKGHNYNNLFQITEITREVFPDYQYQAIMRLITTKNTDGTLNIRNQRAFDLIEKYKKSHNFGACWIKYKTIVRGAKVITTNRVTRFCEFNCLNTRNVYRVVDPVAVMAQRSSEASLIDYKVQRLLNKQKALNNTKNAIEAYLDSLKPKPQPKPLIKPETKVECVEDSLLSKLL
jgi:hypothetical protein